MKIFYLYSELTIKGGADKVLIDKANYLAEHGYEVAIVTEAQLGRPPIFPLSPKVKHYDMGLDFMQQYRQGMVRRLLTHSVLMRKYRKQLRQLLVSERPDIVITTMGRNMIVTGMKLDGSVVIGEAHTTKHHLRSLHTMEARGGIYKWAARWMRRQQINNVRRLKAIVLLTEEDARDWEGLTKTYVIPNSIPNFPEKSSSLENKQAIMVGRYNDAKGYEYLVEAWADVHRRHPDWTLNIYGSGEMHDDVERWIKERGLQATMVMHDPTDHIMEKYLESSLCVVSSRYEGFSMVILEAMASGVPCVSFDCPFGPRHIIRDGEDGLLVEHLNTQALADGICRLIEDEPLRKQLGAKAKENIRRFSQESVMSEWEELFKSLVAAYKHGN